MATWMVHFRVADALLDGLDNLHYENLKETTVDVGFPNKCAFKK